MAGHNNNSNFLPGLGMDFGTAQDASTPPAQTPAPAQQRTRVPSPATGFIAQAPTQQAPPLAGLGIGLPAPPPAAAQQARRSSTTALTPQLSPLTALGIFAPAGPPVTAQQQRSASSPAAGRRTSRFQDTFNATAEQAPRASSPAPGQQAPRAPRVAPSRPASRFQGIFDASAASQRAPRAPSTTQQAPRAPSPAPGPQAGGMFERMRERNRRPVGPPSETNFQRMFREQQETVWRQQREAEAAYQARVEQLKDAPIDESKLNNLSATDYGIGQNPFADFDSVNPAFANQYNSSDGRTRSLSSAPDFQNPSASGTARARSLDSDAYLDSRLSAARSLSKSLLTDTPDQARARYEAAIKRISGPQLGPEDRLRFEAERRGYGTAPAPAFRWSRGSPAPNIRGRIAKPNSPAWRRAETGGSPGGVALRPTEIPRLPSPLNPNPPDFIPPSTPRAEITFLPRDKGKARVSFSETPSPRSRDGTSTFESPRAAPKPPQRGSLVAYSDLPPSLPTGSTFPPTSAELEELSGMDRETALHLAADAAVSAPLDPADPNFLKIQRALFKFRTEQENLRLQAAGKPLLRNSNRVAELPEDRAQFSRALLHEYHERYTTMREQWQELVKVQQNLEETQGELDRTENARSELEREMLGLQEELDAAFAMQRSERAEHDAEVEAMRERYARLKERTTVVVQQHQAARSALADFQTMYTERTEEITALQSRLTELQAERESTPSAPTETQVPSDLTESDESGPSQQTPPPTQEATTSTEPRRATPQNYNPAEILKRLMDKAGDIAKNPKSLFMGSIPAEPLSEAEIVGLPNMKTFASSFSTQASQYPESKMVTQLMDTIEETQKKLKETEERAQAAEEELEEIRLKVSSRPSSSRSEGSNNEFFDCEEDQDDAETKELKAQLTKCLLHGQALEADKEKLDQELTNCLQTLVDSKAGTEVLTAEMADLQSANRTLTEQLAPKPKSSTSTDANGSSQQSSSTTPQSSPPRTNAARTASSPRRRTSAIPPPPIYYAPRRPPPPFPRTPISPIPENETDPERRRRWSIRIALARQTPEWIALREERHQIELREEEEQAELIEARDAALAAMDLPEPSDDPISFYHDIADAIRRREREKKFPRSGRR